MEKNVCANCSAENPVSYKYCSKCGHELPKIVSPADTTFESKSENIKAINRSNRTKNIVGAVAGVLFFILSYYAVQYFFFRPPSMDKVMTQLASELNKTCPMMIDQETRLDNTIALPDKVFQYNFTLVNFKQGALNPEELKATVEPTIVNNIRTNPAMKIQRDSKWTLNYYYKDMDGVYLFEIKVTPDKYEEEPNV